MPFTLRSAYEFGAHEPHSTPTMENPPRQAPCGLRQQRKCAWQLPEVSEQGVWNCWPTGQRPQDIRTAIRNNGGGTPTLHVGPDVGQGGGGPTQAGEAIVSAFGSFDASRQLPRPAWAASARLGWLVAIREWPVHTHTRTRTTGLDCCADSSSDRRIGTRAYVPSKPPRGLSHAWWNSVDWKRSRRTKLAAAEVD